MSFLFFFVVLSELYLGAVAALGFRALIAPRWIEPLVPGFLALRRLQWILPVLFLGVVWLSPSLFPWAAAGTSAPGFRGLYLSRAAFLVRGIAYWGLWILISHFAVRKKAWTGAFGIVLLLFSGSLAAVDWIESLDASLASTIFGFIFLISGLLAAFAFAFFVSGYRAEPEVRQDNGSVHFALVCVWTYLSVMQLLVAYAGNKPDEAHWFLLREHHGWQAIPMLLGLFQFFGPFLLLMQSPVKRSARFARGLALASLGWQVVFAYWQIAPAFYPSIALPFSTALALAALAAVLFTLGRAAHAEGI